MAEPKKKLSKTRTNLRRSTYSVKSIGVTCCANCKETILPHLICPHCSYYGGKITTQAESKSKTLLKPEPTAAEDKTVI